MKIFQEIKVIYNAKPEWVMVWAPNGISKTFQDLLKVHYNVSYLTIMLKEYPNKGE